jgi:CsoR family transcriptional regulator, copper-sensing transcriptional repressor
VAEISRDFPRLGQARRATGLKRWWTDRPWSSASIASRGQVRGIEKMVVDDRYCIDILTQLGAVTTALESLGLQILDQHVKHCVAGALASGDEADAQQKSEELLEAVKRFAKVK